MFTTAKANLIVRSLISDLVGLIDNFAVPCRLCNTGRFEFFANKARGVFLKWSALRPTVFCPLNRYRNQGDSLL